MIAAILFLCGQMVVAAEFAASQTPLTRSVEFTKEAITDGQEGKADSLSMLAGIALKYAEEANEQQHSPQLIESIKHLKLAVLAGRNGRVIEGTSHAEEALKSLNITCPGENAHGRC
jgi:hypothetical protein